MLTDAELKTGVTLTPNNGPRLPTVVITGAKFFIVVLDGLSILIYDEAMRVVHCAELVLVNCCRFRRFEVLAL
jgi:hypothetical protein